MPIWKLTPIDDTADHWEASTYKGEVIVRASSEQEARKTAAGNFYQMRERIHGGLTPWGSPWDYSHIVSCQRLEDSHYEQEGPVAILYPNI